MRAIRVSLSILCLLCRVSPAQVNLVTANGGNDRTNANLQEVQLSPATVNADSFGKLATFSLDGQVYSQPLYVSNLSIPGQGAYNVLFVSTMHNTVYALDADATPAGKVLWQVSLGAPVASTLLFGANGDISKEVGILSTGTIDIARGVLYVVNESLHAGVPAFSLHALDLASGAERMNGPVLVQASVPGTGSASSGGVVAFDPMQHIQRPALLLANGSVYIAFGSHADKSPFHGWLMSYDAGDLTRQAGVYMSTPDGDGGSFWQSGRGIAADDRGNLYAAASNGDYDAKRNFGQSFLKLPGSLSGVSASFTPPDWKSMSDNDADVAGGPALINSTRTMIGSDKAGNLYVLNADATGQAPPQRTTVSGGPIFNFAVWNRPGNPLIFSQGAREPVQAFQLTAAGLDPKPVSIASAAVEYARIGLTLSANGARDGSGILWETTGNYNDGNAPGTLHAFNASNLAIELWNSDMNGSRDTMPPMAKFASPTVVNGKVFVPTFGNAVVVYGLFAGGALGASQPAIESVANSASFSIDAVSPGELVSIFGSNLGPPGGAGAEIDRNGLVATVLANVEVLFDGIAAPLLYVSDSQINCVAPFGIASPTTQIAVLYNGQMSDSAPVPVVAATPAVFSQNGSGIGAALIVNQDGSLNTPATGAPAGSIVTLYGTGAGQTDPPGRDGGVVSAGLLPRPVLPVTATIGGIPAKVLYAGGAPGLVQGVLLVNIEIPQGAPSGAAVPVVLTVGDQASSGAVTIAIQ